MIMTKDEIKDAYRWPANGESPLDRDVQIQLMLSAKERHDAVIARLKQEKSQ